MNYKCVFVIFLLIGCESDDHPTLPIYNATEAVHTTDQKFAVDAINDYRKDSGLSILKTDSISQSLAQKHSEYMFSTQTTTHEGFIEINAYLISLGADGVGEIIAGGYKTTDAAVRSWINSESHEAVIKGNYTYFGVGIKGRYYTIIFIRI